MELNIVLLNFLYAMMGAGITLGFMMLGYYLFDKITPFDLAEELGRKNIAVAIVTGSVIVGLGVAIGLVIGMGLN